MVSDDFDEAESEAYSLIDCSCELAGAASLGACDAKDRLEAG